MQGLQKIGFLSLVCFFGTASIFVAGTDLQRRLVRHTEEEKQAAQKLIEELRGEKLAPHESGVVHASSIPSRKGGSALADTDKSKIKKFLGSLFASEPEQPAQDQPPKANEDAHVPSEVAEREVEE